MIDTHRVEVQHSSGEWTMIGFPCESEEAAARESTRASREAKLGIDSLMRVVRL